jgi:hypothetical protein
MINDSESKLGCYGPIAMQERISLWAVQSISAIPNQRGGDSCLYTDRTTVLL